MMNQQPEPLVLVVDDAELNIDVLVECLGDAYDVAVAMDGERALELAREQPPDLILLDIMMPGIDGYEVCRRLKADEATRAIPVIFVTALGDVADETKGLELGAVDYITKPISAPIVQARVKTHLMLARQKEQLARQNAELIEAALLKEEVDRIMVHDLKNPLTSILLSPELIRRRGGLNEDQLRSLDIIEDSGRRLLSMIDLSLSLFKMERGTYPYEPVPVDLLAVIRKIEREFRSIIQMERIELKVRLHGRAHHDGDRAVILGEELLCYSMLSNLLKNALQASPPGGTVTVEFEFADNVQVAIHNMGAVPESIRDTFFEKYATAGKSGGTGLGTYSARLFAETQGGRIVLETSETEGTTVTVALPPPEDGDEAPVEKGQQTGSETPAGWDGPSVRLLLVDDDANGLLLLRKHLEHPSLDVHTAASGREAVEKCAETEFDVVLMDVEMPGMNGQEAATLVRANPETGSRTHLVALSAHDDAETRKSCFDAGFDEYLVKPMSGAQILAALAAVVRGRPLPEQVGDHVAIDADIRELVPGFLRDKRAEIDDLRRTLDSGDLEPARARCHQLRGTAHMYGFVGLSELAAQAEASATRGDIVTLTACLAEVASYLDGVQVRYEKQ